MSKYRVWADEDDRIETESGSVESAVWDWLNSPANEHVRDEFVAECGNSFDVYVDDGYSTTLYRGHTEMILLLETKRVESKNL